MRGVTMSFGGFTLRLLAFAVALLTVPLAAGEPETGHLAPARLRCEYAVDPLGIDVAKPRLFWHVESPDRGERQTAWHVLVASSAESLTAGRGDLWDSGRVDSDETAHIRYAGAALASSQQIHWKVRVWDRRGTPSAWSVPATWTMGVLKPEEWKGIWIAAPAATESLLLRRSFEVRGGLRRAVVHVSGLGQYELAINGSKVGQDLLSPGWTDYARTSLYDTYDVTASLREGRNAAGIILGNGMYHVVRRNRFAKFTGSFGPLRAVLHLRLEYADGTTAFVGTDGTWRVHPGPITYSSIYGGEDHDARLEPRGWSTPGFDDAAWARAVPVIRLEDVLRGHSAGAEPIRAIETHRPVGIRAFADGTSVYDFGQNASFMPRLRVAGPAGSTVRLTPAEVIAADGTIFRGTMGSAARGSSWWQYTKATDADEDWFPRFYYVGSRYVQAEFFAPGETPPTATARQGGEPPSSADATRLPRLISLDAVIVHSSAEPVGTFASANPRLNAIRDLVRWAQRSNMVSVLTDCPHREKLGWIEQFHLNGPSLRYEFDTARLFTKAMRDMAEAQLDDGLVPNIAPEYTEFKGAFRGAAEWGAAFILVPWQQYLFDGDSGLLREHYEAMTRYVAYLDSRVRDGILADGLGDWYDFDLATPGRANLTPPPITATAYYYLDVFTMSQIARVLGKDGDAEAYGRKAAAIRERYNREFFDAARLSYGTGSQASLAIPLALGLAEPAGSGRQAVLDALVRDIERRGYTTAGDVGFRSVLQALAGNARSDVVYRLIDQDEKPGYGYQIKKGGTSLAESWDASLSTSQNHFILGQIIEWFYQDLAGITVDEAGPGFKTFVLRPQPVDGLAWAEARYHSLRGRISSRWERHGDRLTLTVTIPANTSADVYVPSRNGAAVTEGGAAAASRPGVSFLRRNGDAAVYRVESGHYVFDSRW
ncbi:MAG: family 78 glycoside hydrolase catalytic domain [Vicinamibacterales bacterium]|nr:family 78 glycoside hydrolase catalytic domain [Vicinamibacterales bacterium]